MRRFRAATRDLPSFLLTSTQGWRPGLLHVAPLGLKTNTFHRHTAQSMVRFPRLTQGWRPGPLHVAPLGLGLRQYDRTLFDLLGLILDPTGEGSTTRA